MIFFAFLAGLLMLDYDPGLAALVWVAGFGFVVLLRS